MATTESNWKFKYTTLKELVEKALDHEREGFNPRIPCEAPPSFSEKVLDNGGLRLA